MKDKTIYLATGLFRIHSDTGYVYREEPELFENKKEAERYAEQLGFSLLKWPATQHEIPIKTASNQKQA